MQDEKKDTTKKLQDLVKNRGSSKIIYEQYQNKYIVRRSNSSYSDNYQYKIED